MLNQHMMGYWIYDNRNINSQVLTHTGKKRWGIMAKGGIV